MRHFYLLIFFLFVIPATMFAQKGEPDITGLWKGTIYNDTFKMYYQYEIGISAKKGKLSGFSHTWFILDDKQYYGVKEVTVKWKDGKVLIEDDVLIANNYPEPPAKGVRQLNILTLDASDSIMKLSGPFVTNGSKKFRAMTGTIELQRKNDYWQSALVPHLQELNLAGELSFVKDDALLARNNIIIAEKNKQEIAVQNTVKAPSTKPAPVKPVNISTQEVTSSAKTQPANSVAINPERLPDNKTDTVYGIASSIKIVKDEKTIVTDDKKQAPIAVAKVTPPPVVVETPIKANANTNATSVVSKPTTPLFPIQTAAADVSKRTTLLQQTVTFHSDSLQISLYDNGEVDGDTVSVLMNGEIIMAKERLSTNAIRKTIYIPKETDTVELIMYAENLGTIPPNTGLLVVRDGKDLYEIRFSGDLQKNAAIIFRRKKE